MAEHSKRARLSLARPPKQKRPSLALVKKALRLFSGRGISKATRHANARKWLTANHALGERHLLRGGSPKWGQPGEPNVPQVMAPRRLGRRA
jgi:hypothetical protein